MTWRTTAKLLLTFVLAWVLFGFGMFVDTGDLPFAWFFHLLLSPGLAAGYAVGYVFDTNPPVAVTVGCTVAVYMAILWFVAYPLARKVRELYARR